jgi:uncharacterized membrane-anchored protein
MCRPLLLSAALVLTLIPMGAAPALSQELAPGEQGPQIDWVEGPHTVDLGKNLAEIRVGSNFIFAGPEDTRTLMKLQGNPPTNLEVGYITPAAENENWFIVFEYEDVGHVKDDEKDEIDADALLKGMKEGTEEANKIRKEMGVEALHLTGWHEPPHYDAATHNLVWATDNRTEGGEQVINYNVRLLGREGVMSATLVASPGELAVAKAHTTRMLEAFKYKPGQRYAEFTSGDKLAEYGLTALIAGGAGAAAAKFGLFSVLGKFLAKAWKLVVLAFLGLGAAVKKLFSGRGGKVRHGVPDPEPR